LADAVSIGLLARVFPASVVDGAVDRCGVRERLNRQLPARLMVYFLLGCWLWSDRGYVRVLRELVAGLRWARGGYQGWKLPYDGSISKARVRLGDAVMADLSNNVGCIFSTGPPSLRYCVAASQAFRANNRAILANDANLYPAWTALRTNLKLIPLLGCQNLRDVVRDPAGKSGFQKAIEYFDGLMARYPGLSVVYGGHPLMLVYLGTPASPRIIRRCRAVIRTHAFAQHYTFRFLTGYLDSQWPFWKNPSEHPLGPIEIAPRYGFWSWVDRYKPDYGLYPTYSTAPGNPSQPENFTVSIAVAGREGWGCPQPRYCPDASLRHGHTSSTYVTLQSFMKLAAQLKPTFVIVHQFNEFTMADEGWNAQTSDDIEPTRLPKGWLYTAVDAVHTAVAVYRRVVPSP